MYISFQRIGLSLKQPQIAGVLGRHKSIPVRLPTYLQFSNLQPERKRFMAFTLYSFDETVDRRFIVTRSVKNQAKIGTMVHIMGYGKVNDGYAVKYRVAGTNRDFTIKFENVKQFCKWARPDTFISRYYEFLSAKDIEQYLKVNNRSFTSFCLPIMLVLWAVCWLVSLLVIKGTAGVIVGAVLTVLVFFVVMKIYKSQKSKVRLKLFNQVSSNWGVSFQ